MKTKVRASKRKAADARVGGASAKHRLITLRLLAHSLLLRAFVSATAQPQAQDSSRRSRSADLRVSSTPFGAAAVASSGAASAHDSQALAAEVQAAPHRLWVASSTAPPAPVAEAPAWLARARRESPSAPSPRPECPSIAAAPAARGRTRAVRLFAYAVTRQLVSRSKYGYTKGEGRRAQRPGGVPPRDPLAST